jgi:hypothetical protein
MKSQLFGDETMENFRAFSIIFRPCIPQQWNSSNAHLENTTCLANHTETGLEKKKKESLDYLGAKP